MYTLIILVITLVPCFLLLGYTTRGISRDIARAEKLSEDEGQ